MAAVAASEKIRAAIWIVLCIALAVGGLQAFWAWSGIAGSRSGIAVKQLVVPVALGLTCVLTAVAIACGWKVARWLGGVGGVVLILYALALVLLGSEDVGGARISVPAGLLIGAFGAWNLRSSIMFKARAA